MNELLSNLGVMTEAQLCEMCGIEQKTAQNWRATGDGPAFIKAGNAIFYRHQTVARWLAQKEATNAAQHQRRK